MFTLLTHPHLDHFRGLERVYGEFGPNTLRACLFQGTTELEMIRLFDRQLPQPERSEAEYRYYRSYGGVLEAYRKKLSVHQRLHAGDGTEICAMTLISANGERVPFRVRALAPSYDDCREFLEELQRSNCFDLAAGRQKRLRQKCNRVSVILSVEFGATRAILGGDAELPSWEQVLRKCAPQHLSSHLLKVSHHGSPTALNAILARALSHGKGGDNRTTAVITPSFLHDLPSSRVVEHLKSAFDDVLVTTKRSQNGVDASRVRLALPTATGVVAGRDAGECQLVLRYDHCGRRLSGVPPHLVL